MEFKEEGGVVTGDLVGVGGRGGVQEEEQVVLSVLEVEVEFKEEEEQGIWWVLEVEVEFKEEEEQGIWWVLEVEVEFKEEEEE